MKRLIVIISSLAILILLSNYFMGKYLSNKYGETIKQNTSDIIKFDEISINPLCSKIKFTNFRYEDDYKIKAQKASINLSYSDAYQLLYNNKTEITSLSINFNNTNVSNSEIECNAQKIKLNYWGSFNLKSPKAKILDANQIELKLIDGDFIASNNGISNNLVLDKLFFDKVNIQLTDINTNKTAHYEVDIDSKQLNCTASGQYDFSSLSDKQISARFELETNNYNIFYTKKNKNNSLNINSLKCSGDLNLTLDTYWKVIYSKSLCDLRFESDNMNFTPNLSNCKGMNLASFLIPANSVLDFNSASINTKLNKGHLTFTNSKLTCKSFDSEINANINLNDTNPELSKINNGTTNIKLTNVDIQNQVAGLLMLSGLKIPYNDNSLSLEFKGSPNNILIKGKDY